MSTSYRYRAAQPDGAIRAGAIEARTQPEAAALLRGRGLIPIRLEQTAAAEDARAPASRRDLAMLFESLDALVGAGVSLDRALAASEAMAAARFKALLPSLREALRQGDSFSSALSRSGGLIPPSVIGTLRAGEAGSQLRIALHQVSLRLQAEADLLARLRQALAYPAVLLAAGLVSIGIITLGVLPRFAALLTDVGQTLPPATRVLLVVSDLAQRYGVLVLVCAMAVAIGGVLATREGSGRLALDQVLLGLPVIGPIRHGLGTARVTGALAGMLQSGVPLLAALQEAGLAASDAEIHRRMAAVRERVSGGEPLAVAATQEAALTASALQLLHIGEQSGQLASMAARASTLAAAETERALRMAVGLLEPGLVIALGGLVAFVAAALLQAVYSLRPG
ncbi:MAG: type II secretion system F family protein [Gemmatimonadota bacterium]|nr:type II secretion system F family protein [Gemmatimonadota bacterium]